MCLQRDAEGCDVERGCNIPSNCGSPAECGELTEKELLIVALNLYGLQHTHVIHEGDPDTKVQIYLITVTNPRKALYLMQSMVP